MVGKYKVEVDSGRDCFSFEVCRKYTVIRGYSGAGKTLLNTLVDMGKRSSHGIKITCSIPVKAVTNIDLIPSLGKCIVIIDEDTMDEFYEIDNFKTFVKMTEHSDAYFVLITRHKMSAVPYSCMEIYELVGIRQNKNSINYSLERMYDWNEEFNFTPDCILTEDSNSGYQFFSKTVLIPVISASGKSSIVRKVNVLYEKGYRHIFIVADGAALGPEIGKLVDFFVKYNDLYICLYAPESFEYVLLKSDIFKKFNIQRFLDETYNYADSKVFLSWERYYTSLISKLSRKFSNKDAEYSKSKLSNFYLAENNVLYVFKEIGELNYVEIMGKRKKRQV